MKPYDALMDMAFKESSGSKTYKAKLKEGLLLKPIYNV